ncbi:MAG TPA: hypothetical protein VN939_13775 [Chthoniobacterales bacterium]|nr:hypothetical protein [Chthoniobacterales bacterium]
MFTITHNFAPAHPLLHRNPVEKPLTEQKERTDRTVQPQTRLWKLTAETVKPKMVRGELLVLLVFLAVVVSATGLSVQELSRLMRSNAIEHVAARALQGSE